jgi:hypothetical protein
MYGHLGDCPTMLTPETTTEDRGRVMDDAAQKLVDELIRLYEPERAEVAGLPEELNAENLDAWAPFVMERTARTRQLLSQLRIALEAAQRPPVSVPYVTDEGTLHRHSYGEECNYLSCRPVSPEVREEVVEWFHVGFCGLGSSHDEDGTPHVCEGWADALLARFSFPSQPVYDEEKIVAWFDSVRERVPYRFGGFQRIWLDDDALAAALVAALRGGDLTREETNRG